MLCFSALKAWYVLPGGQGGHPVPVLLCQRLRLPQAEAARPEGEADAKADAEADPETNAEADPPPDTPPGVQAHPQAPNAQAAHSEEADSQAAHSKADSQANSQAPNSEYFDWPETAAPVWRPQSERHRGPSAAKAAAQVHCLDRFTNFQCCLLPWAAGMISQTERCFCD